MSADGVFDAFKSEISRTKNPVAKPAYSLISAKPYQLEAQFFVTSDGADRPAMPIVTKIGLCESVSDGVTVKANVLAQLTREELRQFYRFVQENTDNNYRNCKQNALWKEAYGVHDKWFDTYSSKTRTKGSVCEPATYCQKCGIVLPLRNLTIDHQKPRAGGEVEAMMRVFRAAGLTQVTGAGVKNRFLQRQVAAAVGGTTNVVQFGAKGDLNQRYTLNEKGILFFTVLIQNQMYDDMLGMSMHHIVNLRPMCGSCNSRLGNSNVIFN